ncbi:2-methylisocitrate lyase-like PEP mutase family enzyme [Micromonospora sp. Llam0]|uniref:isocitrate lyase/PEP mutase family protein n=1 Tax=Micromonospora sp. Llam0 TaxID=2485143 RepID=UPI000F47722C|nr:isocitrate lyase/phosphoenolpyruvate mutase family protein [Micromonospora sp. Llam0]ROO62592.1 2-methylisocitrate lyase-like PEP mutase family enzyme [Micromonospora sp. Llam0]
MAADAAELKARADLLRDLHSGDLLILPNVWDAASAKVVVDAGFPVAATASAAISAMLGYPDGEVAPWQELFAAASRVAGAVTVPTTVDAEAGYGLPPADLVERLLETGAVGCNLEDSDHRAGGLTDAEAFAGRLAQVRAAAENTGVPIVINARVDVFLPGSRVPEPDRVAEAVRRGRLYRDAGADCIYPIGVRSRDDLATLVTELDCPVNGNVSDQLDLAVHREIGTARVSFGPRFFRAALAGFEKSVKALTN